MKATMYDNPDGWYVHAFYEPEGYWYIVLVIKGKIQGKHKIGVVLDKSVGYSYFVEAVREVDKRNETMGYRTTTNLLEPYITNI